ncbi:MAG TPA: pilin, partial [Candidatus Gracilibacteria bacterium]|nr:pilin [Candidatus Gracilibacteria bacterium]
DLLKYGMGTIAVIVIIASGVRLITAGKQIEEIAGQQKENIKYALIGLIVIMMADVLVKEVFFGEQGEVFRSEADAQMAAERGTEQIRGLYNFIEYFIGAIAVLMIVISGIRMVLSAGNEEILGKTKKQIMWAIAGLVLVGVSELLVKDIVFPEQGSQLSDVNRARELIVNITNFVSAFIATVAIAMFMYGGFLYVTATGKEDQTAKAKKVLMGAAIGIVIAMAAFALVNTFVKFEAPGAVPNLGQ